ncbi:hypothetical protein ABIA16_003406 [Sinorhizobium fredii]
MIDEMHVVDARRTGGHAGKAGETTVDMGDGFGIGRSPVFQHVLDEIDPSARTVEFVAEQHIGRTGGGAEAAMDAFAQDLFRFGDMRVGELLWRKICLQPDTPLSILKRQFLNGAATP